MNIFQDGDADISGWGVCSVHICDICSIPALLFITGMAQPGYWGIFRYKYTEHQQPARPSTLIIR